MCKKPTCGLHIATLKHPVVQATATLFEVRHTGFSQHMPVHASQYMLSLTVHTDADAPTGGVRVWTCADSACNGTAVVELGLVNHVLCGPLCMLMYCADHHIAVPALVCGPVVCADICVC